MSLESPQQFKIQLEKDSKETTEFLVHALQPFGEAALGKFAELISKDSELFTSKVL